MSVALADLVWPQAERVRAGVLVVPIGATEQHGPHLPLSTDTDIAVALADRPSSTSTCSTASRPIETVPAKPACSPLDP